MKNPKFCFANIEKQMVPCKSTAEEVSFEWSHHRISSTDSKVRTTLHVSIIDSGSDRVNQGSVLSILCGNNFLCGNIKSNKIEQT